MTKLVALPLLREKRSGFCTQQEMTDLLKLNTSKKFQRSYYALIETGDRPVDAELALTIARILKEDVDKLFQSEDAVITEPLG